jgi:hypothetical protein
MMSAETVTKLRGLTTAERLRLTLRMMREATPFLLSGSREQIGRRFERIRRENDERNRRMLEGLARSRNSQ